jgi:hypothetical protein
MGSTLKQVLIAVVKLAFVMGVCPYKKNEKMNKR